MMENDKLNKVVGLRYRPDQGLPRVVVKGSGETARQILKNRPIFGGPRIFKNAELAEQLYRLPVDAEISRDTFQLVAILLAHVFAVEHKLKGENE